MGNYNTTSGFNDLIGSMTTDGGDNVLTYTSDARGAGVVTNQGGTGLHFHVSFTGVSNPYNINANSNSNGFSGHAKDNDLTEAEEAWTATATTAAQATGSY